jgi:lipopolysaccharide transport system ATP-binding protein
VAEILKYSALERFTPYKIYQQPGSLLSTPVVPGRVYGTVYATQQELMGTIKGDLFPPLPEKQAHPYYRRALINWWNFGVLKKRYVSFVVIRDLRDTLVSLYFSIKHSHVMSDDKLIGLREELAARELESGLTHIISDRRAGLGLTLATSAQIQESWLGQPNILYLRYEDMLGREREFFERLIDYCEISVSREQLHAIVDNNLFERVTGRPRGQEDIHAHLRRGIAGDWRNYFTEPVKLAFKQQFGHLLIKTGYEKDLHW